MDSTATPHSGAHFVFRLQVRCRLRWPAAGIGADGRTVEHYAYADRGSRSDQQMPLLFTRFPQLRLAVTRSELRWTHGDGLVLRGLAELPIRLGVPTGG